MRTTRGALALFFIDTLSTTIPNGFRGVNAKFNTFLLAHNLEYPIGLHLGQLNDSQQLRAAKTKQITGQVIDLFSHSKNRDYMRER
ncbi:MAG: hypothetical protein HKN87_07095 [Saprospiraceae bacterium]|nr:hypothetical protein [Saprospiraceae bacterium]